MSDTVAIVTDSTSCLSKELIDRYQIEVVPIRIVAQGTIYRDSIDIIPAEAYECFLQDPDSYSTSPSSP